MKAHVSILGFVYALLGALQILGAALVGLFGVGGGMLTWVGGGQGSGAAGAFIGIFGVGIALIILFYGALTALTGWGLLTRASWGRWLGVIASVLHVLSLSWVSLFGIYGLWALLSKDSHEVFSKRL
jgi:hypothetical protein